MCITEPREPSLDGTEWEYRTETIPTMPSQGDPYWILIEDETGPPVPSHIGETDAYEHQLEVTNSDGATLYKYTTIK